MTKQARLQAIAIFLARQEVLTCHWTAVDRLLQETFEEALPLIPTCDDVMRIARQLRLRPTPGEITRTLLMTASFERGVDETDLVTAFQAVHPRPRTEQDLLWWLEHGDEGGPFCTVRAIQEACPEIRIDFDGNDFVTLRDGELFLWTTGEEERIYDYTEIYLGEWETVGGATYESVFNQTGKNRTTTDDIMAVAYELRRRPSDDDIIRLMIKCERVWQSGGAVEHSDLIEYFKQVCNRPREKEDLIWWLQHGREGDPVYHQSDIYNAHSWVEGGRLYVADGLFVVSARLLPPGWSGGEPLIDTKDWQ